MRSSVFFFNDTATTEIYTLSLHDALPISTGKRLFSAPNSPWAPLVNMMATPMVAIMGIRCGELRRRRRRNTSTSIASRSEEHTSELQSRLHLVCRLLLEKKKTNTHLASNE